MTNDEISNYLYNPSLIIKKLLHEINKDNPHGLSLTDKNNPFSMLLECSSSLTYNNLLETENKLNRFYPHLATNKRELLSFMSIEDNYLYSSVPSSANFTFFINTVDLKSRGVKKDNYTEVMIPIDTVIKVHDVDFTLLNDIIVRIHSDNTIIVEQLPNDNYYASNDIHLLESNIVNSSDSSSWIVFKTRVKQLSLVKKILPVLMGENFTFRGSFKDNFVTCGVRHTSDVTGNKPVNLNVTYGDELINPLVPTACVNIDDSFDMNIPSIYIISGQIAGIIEVSIYSSKNKLYMPLNKYRFDDFKITLGDIKRNNSTASLVNISMLVNCSEIVNSGSDSYTVDELREIVLNNSIGYNNLPITEKQLFKFFRDYGYKATKEVDLVDSRTYTIHKSLPSIDSRYILAKPDLLSSDVTFLASSYKDIVINGINDDYIGIPSNTLFKLTDNKVSIVKKEELDLLSNLTNAEKVIYCNEKELYFTQFSYYIRKNTKSLTCKIYDFDKPSMDNYRIKNVNYNSTVKTSVDKYTFYKTKKGFSLDITLRSNFENNKLLLCIPIDNSNEYIFFDFNKRDKTYTCDIDTDLMINKDNLLFITNGFSTLNKRIKTKNKVYLLIYKDKSIGEIDSFEPNVCLKYIDRNVNTIITEVSFDLLLGIEIKNLYNRVFNTYTDNKYLRYEEDVPKIYKEDIYEVYDDGETFKIVNDELIYNITHRKNDIVFDNNNVVVMEHVKDDFVLDENGKRMIDHNSGIEYVFSVQLIPYSFSLANNTSYKDYLVDMKNVVLDMLTVELPNIENRLLDNSRLFFKSNKVLDDIKNSSVVILKPTVVLYLEDVSIVDISITRSTVSIIGRILDEELDKEKISLMEIKNRIKNEVNLKVLGTSLFDIIDEEIFVYKNENRFIVDKKIELYNGDYVVVYDIQLNFNEI